MNPSNAVQLPNDKAADALTKGYDAEAAAYLAYWAPVLHEPSLKLVDEIATASPERILDIGAGTGALFSVLATRFPEAQIFGVDRSAGMLLQSRSGIPLAVMDALHLAFPNDLFDVALMCFVLFHFPDAVAGLGEASRVLKRGGTLCVSTWASDIQSPAVDIWNELLEASGADEVPRLANHDLMDSPDKVTDLLASAGFLSARAATHEFVFQIRPDDFLNLRIQVGASSQRLQKLSNRSRLELINCAREKFAEMSSEDFILRMLIILASAHAP